MTVSHSQIERIAAQAANTVLPLPAAGSPLSVPTTGILVQTAGNMGLVFSDGSTNNSALVAVTAGQYFPFNAVSASASNTAVLLAIGGAA